jgi:predicted nucleotidyltransferase component of viral defense system
VSKNVAASVRARLANLARESGRPFQEVLQYYGLERFLYRLSQTQHRDRFVLKGALMLRVWDTPESRPTRDIDLLGHLDGEVATLEAVARDICSADVADDGLRFDGETISGERIKEDADYQGVRIKLTGFLGNARIPVQLDVAFGDVMHPSVDERDYPTILAFPAPNLRTYPRESVVAEKFQAMVYLGTLNSRMKDFYDIWLLARQFDFVGADLAAAIEKTFRNRKTAMETNPVALTEEFTQAERPQRQWQAFLKRSNLDSAPSHLDELREPLRDFLLTVADSLATASEFNRTWAAGGPWID